MQRLDTPRGPVYRWTPTGAAPDAVVVYVHGHRDTAASAVQNHDLEQQFQRSGRRATFLVPEAPSGSGQTVHFPDLPELLRLAGQPPTAQVVAVAHSGGYRTVLGWLRAPQLRHIILLDAVYGGSPSFEAWAQAPGHTLDIVGQDTAAASKRLATATGSPYQDHRSHMGIVLEGKIIPALLRRAPLPGALGGLIATALVAFVGWGAWRLFR